MHAHLHIIIIIIHCANSHIKLYPLQPLHAQSLEKACQSFDSNCEDPILVGGKHFIIVQKDDIPEELQVHLTCTDMIGTSCRSVLFMHHGVKGTLYRTGEHILICDTENDEQCIIQVTTFFAVMILNEYYTFVKGEMYLHHDDEPTHTYSSNPFVFPTAERKVFKVNNNYYI